MNNLQFEILKKLKETNGMYYKDLSNSLSFNPNDTLAMLIALVSDKAIHSSKNLHKERDGFITLTVKGITLYYSELEYREFMRIQDKKLRKQFKVTQIIAVISAVAVVLQVILAYAEFFKLR